MPATTAPHRWDFSTELPTTFAGNWAHVNANQVGEGLFVGNKKHAKDVQTLVSLGVTRQQL